MPRKTCCVLGCRNTSKKATNMTYFRLPKEDDRRAIWLQLMIREELMEKNPHYYVVCETHFEPQCILLSSNRKLLKKNALPSLFLPKTDKRSTNEQVAEVFDTADQSTQTDKRYQGNHVVKYRKRFNDKYLEKAQTTLYDLSDSLLTQQLAELVKAQIHLKLPNKDTKDGEYNFLYIYLYYSSPQTYRLLQRTLCIPSAMTLFKPLMPLTSKVNDRLMKTLMAKVDKMAKSDKMCSVVVETIELKTNLFYNIGRDRIIGYCEVDGVQTPVPAKKALVVSVQAYENKLTQPIGFALIAGCEDYENISTWIVKILEQLLDVGLDIRTFVTDCEVFNASKEYGSYVSIETPYFLVNNQKFFYIFHLKRLMKMLLFSFMSNDFYFHGSVAKWEHIMQFYKSDRNKSRRLAPKLTDYHVGSTSFENISDRHITQLFSRAVAAGMSTYIDFKALDESARGTVHLISLMYDLLNVFNPSNKSSIYESEKKFQVRDSQTAVLNKAICFFSTLILLDSKNGHDLTTHARFIKEFQLTIRSVLLLSEDLKYEESYKVFTMTLKQNVIEDIFKRLPTKNGSVTTPTSRNFIRAFRKSVFSNIAKLPKRQTDNVACLVANIKRLVNSYSTTEAQIPKSVTVKHEHLPVKEEPLSEEYIFDTLAVEPLPEVNENVTVKEESFNGETVHESELPKVSSSDYDKLDIPNIDPLTYICGYLLKKSMEQDEHCQLLRSYIQPGERSLGNRYILKPPADFIRFVGAMEEKFRAFFEKKILGDKIFKTIFETIRCIEFNPPCPCFPVTYVKTLYIRLQIYHAVKLNNRAFGKSEHD